MPTQKDYSRQVAQTILEQLGSNKFIMMTGAKDFLYKENTLCFKIPKGKDGINYVEIKLNGLDLYDITFKRIHGLKVTDKAKVNNIYADSLRSVFTDHTGLYTNL